VSAEPLTREELQAALRHQRILHVGEVRQTVALLAMPQPPALPDWEPKGVAEDLSWHRYVWLWRHGVRIARVERLLWLLAGVALAFLVSR
jgi:hypothetical protein